MRYLGGKMRQGKHIAQIIAPYLNNKVYIEPFCGAMGSAMAVINYCVKNNIKLKQVILSDIHLPLINMWKAVLYENWIPPSVFTEEQYNAVKKIKNPDDPLTAFAGFGCAFAGKYFGTYARDKKKIANFAFGAKNLIRKKNEIVAISSKFNYRLLRLHKICKS